MTGDDAIPGSGSAILTLPAKLFAITGCAALFVLTATTITGVVARYVFERPIFGIEDVATLSLAVLVASAIAIAAEQGTHMRIDVVPARLDDSLGRAANVIAGVVGLAACSVASLALIRKSECGRACGEVSSNLGIPHLPFYWGFALAFAFYALVLLLDLVALARPRR